jgi:hypothetical protein
MNPFYTIFMFRRKRHSEYNSDFSEPLSPDKVAFKDLRRTTRRSVPNPSTFTLSFFISEFIKPVSGATHVVQIRTDKKTDQLLQKFNHRMTVKSHQGY